MGLKTVWYTHSDVSTQVTTDPEAFQDPKNENPGVVTSDSLAAENIKEGGSFAANADARGPMGQPSYSTNTNTTDTANATRLDPAIDAEARQASEEWSESAALNAGLGQGKDAGRGPTWNTPSADAGSGVSDTTNIEAPTPGAPPTMGEQLKPKGKNVTEGGFDENAPNASFNAEIGGKKDPGRAALGGFQEENVPFAGGAGPREGQTTNDGQYDVLKDASA